MRSEKNCPGCGVEVLIRYRFNELMIEAPCPMCNSMVKWKRKCQRRAFYHIDFDDDMPELVKPEP